MRAPGERDQGTGLALAVFCLLFALSAACSEENLALLPESIMPEQEDELPDLLSRDPFPAPVLPRVPADLLAQAEAYRVYQAEGNNGANSRTSARWIYQVEASSPDAPEVAEVFLKSSLLERLKGSPPASFANLNQRIKSDLEDARAVMHSFAYYDGRCWSRITQESEELLEEASGEGSFTRHVLVRRVTVWIHFRLGQQFTLGRSVINIGDADEQLTSVLSSRGRNLTSLADAGLADGEPATTQAVLEAVARSKNILRNSGYPFAEITGTRYLVDHDHKTLEANISLMAGPFCRMGDLEIQGENRVSRAYLEAMRTWRPGQVWRENQAERFVDNLRRTGLFQTLEVSPGESASGEDLLPVVLTLSPAPERTLSGALKYNSDFGAGVESSWTHRNFSGHGDELKLDMPLWQDMQIFFTQYRRPFVGSPAQDFVAQAALRNEDVKAYSLSSLSVAAGLERRFSRKVSGSLKVSAEAGRLTAADEPRREYTLFGLPASLAYNDTNNPLDAVSGVKLNFALGPYVGTYGDKFTALRGRFDIGTYLPLIAEENTLTLALRGSIGSVMGAKAEGIPTSIRFYSGGGGSVRGYAYQSLGPRNRHDEPLGGASLMEFGMETRWKINETWGITTFVDAGMVYPESTPDFQESLRWGAGIGLRYYTVIGPLRVDLATPLTPRSGDGVLQLYCSIGQSF
ncbi:MAG: BamA/TamA family outer membrane protein [Desulfovibrionaceae bacterium]|nr:BamA/TamA family outer membrane protein [Desulfovibrionaceae bacterium]